MTYTKTTFTNGRSPDIDADYLNNLEDTVYDNDLKLTDLISGVTPTYNGWDVDPTDGANITDGDTTTACTSGSAAVVAWTTADIEFDLGAVYSFMVVGFGGSTATAGTPYIYLSTYIDSNWRSAHVTLSDWTNRPMFGGGIGSKVRLGCTSGSAATVAPAVYELQVLRL